MKYIIYKITNLINGKIYIGQHETDNINDDYYGSGIILRKAIKKYGKNNFNKEILFIFDTFDEMNNKEMELVDPAFIKRKDTYNMVMGGNSGLARFSPEKRSEIIKKISETKNKKDENGISIAMEAYKKRTETITKNNPNGLKDIGLKSSATQIKNGSHKGLKNKNAKLTTFTIYDNHDNKICSMLLTELKNKHHDNLPPIRMILFSLQRDGVPMYSKNNRHKSEKFKGWYALFDDHKRTEKVQIIEYSPYIDISYSYEIYDNNDILIHNCNNKDFKKLCADYGYPENSFRYSYRHDGIAIKHKEFKGWYVKKLQHESIKHTSLR